MLDGFVVVNGAGQPIPCPDVRDEQAIEVYLSEKGAALSLAEWAGAGGDVQSVHRARLTLRNGANAGSLPPPASMISCAAAVLLDELRCTIDTLAGARAMVNFIDDLRDTEESRAFRDGDGKRIARARTQLDEAAIAAFGVDLDGLAPDGDPRLRYDESSLIVDGVAAAIGAAQERVARVSFLIERLYEAELKAPRVAGKVGA